MGRSTTEDAWRRLGEAAAELFRDPRTDAIQEAQRVLVRTLAEQFPELTVQQIVDVLAACEKHGWQLAPKVSVRGVRLDDEVIASVLPGWRFPKVWEMGDDWDSREWARRAARGELGEPMPRPVRESEVEPLELTEEQVQEELRRPAPGSPPRRSWWCRLGLHKIDVCSGVGPCKRPGCDYVRRDRTTAHGWIRHTEPPLEGTRPMGPPSPPAPGPAEPPRPPVHRPVS